MNFKELYNIAKPHIKQSANFPSNAFFLATQLHLPYRHKAQWDKDFNNKGIQNPLNNCPALLYTDNDGSSTIYFNSATRYWNFYIFHEIAHYLLKHNEGNSIQNELDANMLACILIAPLENFPSYIKTARDLSCLCHMPIDRAEEYWQEIRHLTPHYKTQKRVFATITIAAIILVSVVLILFL